MSNRNYLVDKVNPILEGLLRQLIAEQPQKVIDFMVKWLNSEGRIIERAGAGNGGARVETAVQNKKTQQKPVKPLAVQSSESEDDEDDAQSFTADQLIQMKKLKNARSSVSAEVFGKFNQKKAFKPIVIEKSEEQKKRIRVRLEKAFMFSACEEEEINIIVDAMKIENFNEGQDVIRQGEEGNCLYVVDEGQLDCFKRFKQNENNTYLKTYQPGESFGELALLYNAPRAATIISKTNSVLLQLDRQTFNNIVKDAAAKKREKYEEFLSKVDLLSGKKIFKIIIFNTCNSYLLKAVDPYEKMQIADALKTKKFFKGQYIIREGEQGDTFFFLKKGEAIAQKVIDNELTTVYEYESGAYFGELALLRNEPRAASIVVQSADAEVVYLDRDSFKRILGPLEEILKRNVQNYEKIQKK